MFNLLFCSVLSTLYHFACGKIFSGYFDLKDNKFYDLCLISLIGLTSLSFLGLFLNFFTPLDKYINSYIFLIIIFLFIILHYKNLKNFFNILYFKYFFFCSVGTFLILFLSNTYNPDGGLYHFPYTNIINENKIIIGISNLHQRFGHISIMQYLNAHHNNFFLGLNGITIPLASIAVYTIFLFLSNISQIKSLSISKIFSILIIFYFCWKMNRYSEYGNDAPAHFIFFVIILLYLNFIEKKFFNSDQTFFLILLFSIFAFMNKTFLIISLLFPILFIDKKFKNKILSLRFLLLFFFASLWILKNILTTGCLIYPMTSTCFDFSWTNFKYANNVYDVSVGSEAWAKDWANQKINILNYKEYLKGFIWVNFWLENHFKKILGILLPYLIFILSFIFIININTKNRFKNNFILILRKYLPVLTIIFFGFCVWFFKAPIFRYGYSYIISLIALIFSIYIFSRYGKINKKFNNTLSTVIIIIALTVLTLKQTVRIIKNFDKNYINYPWPKYNSYSQDNKIIKTKEIYKKNIFYYYIPETNYCFYSKSPCTSVEVDANVKKMINKYNYKIYYFKK